MKKYVFSQNLLKDKISGFGTYSFKLFSEAWNQKKIQSKSEIKR